ncbi:hypothetical protein PVAND_014937 [Polypedilum vanderplanki]|uniref:Uncharacterized protein n=1 Tax=Polypedilum vanderplanki TaxID=319348 RepID=A0A9J6BAT1_POLVA|nr:hypothetical protein PVAND_014937 [Polypedilum vanderplanki]
MKIYIVLFCAVLIANNQIKNTYAQTTNQPGSSSNRPGQNRQCEIINGLITFLTQHRNNIGCSNSGTGSGNIDLIGGMTTPRVLEALASGNNNVRSGSDESFEDNDSNGENDNLENVNNDNNDDDEETKIGPCIQIGPVQLCLGF